MVNIVGADHTDDASRKQPHKLITVDSDGIGGVNTLVSSVRRVGEYSSSFLDLEDYTRKDIGCR